MVLLLDRPQIYKDNGLDRKQKAAAELVCIRTQNVSDQKMLEQTIEELKEQLNHLVKEKGISDDSVLKLSQLLDTYILNYQLLNYKPKH